MNMSTTDITRNYRSVMMIIYPEYYLAEQDSNYIQWLREQSCQGYPYCPWTMGSQLELQIEFPKQMLDHALTLKELKCNFIWGCFRWVFFYFSMKVTGTQIAYIDSLAHRNTRRWRELQNFCGASGMMTPRIAHPELSISNVFWRLCGHDGDSMWK